MTRRDRTGFVHHASLGTRLTVLLTVPAAAGTFVLRDPIIGLMRRGQFDALDAVNTSRALAGLSIGLVGFSVYLFALRGFYAHRTRGHRSCSTSARTCSTSSSRSRSSVAGVSSASVLAYAFAYLVSSVWALRVLSYKVHGFDIRAVWTSVWRMLLAASSWPRRSGS